MMQARIPDARQHWRQPLLPTPFHARTSEANRRIAWGAWAGYTTALAYEDEAMEYTAIRNQASLYDLSPMVKYRISGPDAAAFLDRLTIRNAAKLPVGAVHYTAWCDDDGHVLDDGTLFRHAPDHFLLCCQERHLPWLLDSATGFDAGIEEITEAVAALALQGPTSASVLRAAGVTAVETLRPFRLVRTTLAGIDLTLSRTGFTGDLGYELWASPDRALDLWDALMDAGRLYGLRPVGTDALNLARIEAGFLVTGLDFVPADTAVRADRARSPFELGLDWMIDWQKGHFTGRRALLAERERGSTWALVGLDIDGNVPAEHAIVYHARKKDVGQITAAAWSPATKRNIALAHVRRPYHERSGDLWVEVYALRELQYARLMLRARVTPRPFFDPARRRATPPADF
jgi:aminomethyltransferase